MNIGYFEALTCNICVCFTIINHLKNHMKRVKGAAASLRKVHQVGFQHELPQLAPFGHRLVHYSQNSGKNAWGEQEREGLRVDRHRVRS